MITSFKCTPMTNIHVVKIHYIDIILDSTYKEDNVLSTIKHAPFRKNVQGIRKSVATIKK